MHSNFFSRNPFNPSAYKDPAKVRRIFRYTAWTAGILFISLLVLIAAIVASVNTDGVHRYLINKAQQEASEKLGVPVRLQNFTLHLSTLGVDLYGVTVAGAAPYATPPLLQVQHCSASVRIVSLWRGDWYFRSIRVDQPVAQIFIGSDGRSNLPTFHSSGNSNSDVFTLGIRHAQVNSGIVYYNNRPSALAADLHNLNFTAAFHPLLTTYTGHVDYQDGRFQYGSYRPILHNVEADFTAARELFTLHHLKLSTAKSAALLSGTLADYTNPSIRANYDFIVDGSEARDLLRLASVPSGSVHTAGLLQYHGVSGHSFLQDLSLSGSLASNRLNVDMPSFRAPVNNLSANYSLANGSAFVHDLKAALLGGQVIANANLANLAGPARSHSDATAELHNISLAQVQLALGKAAQLASARVAGVLNANTKASWGANLHDLVAHSDATVTGRLQPTRPTGRAVPVAASSGSEPSSFPVDSAIHATYTGNTQQLQLDHSYLRSSQTNLTMNGAVSRHSSLVLHLQADDLRQISTLIDAFRTPAPGTQPQPLQLQGQATFDGTVQGSTAAPHLSGQLTTSNFAVNGIEWKTFRTGIDLDPSQLRLRNADLEPASQGQLHLNASVSLNKWAFSNTSPINADLAANRLSLAELAKLSGQSVPITGNLNATIRLHGSVQQPQGNGNIQLVSAKAYNQPLQAATITFSGNGDTARALLSIRTDAGNLDGNVTVQPRQRTYTAQLDSKTIHLDRLEALKAQNVDVSGVIALHATGRGAFDNPQLSAAVQSASLKVQDHTLSALDLRVNIANHLADATLSSAVDNAAIRARGRVNLSGDYLTQASLDTQAIPLQSLVAVYAPDQAPDVTGETEVHATLQGPLKTPARLEAHIKIPTLKVAYQNKVQLAAASPVQADFTVGILHLQPAKISGTDTDLQFQGAIPISSSAPMSLQARGTVNLQLAQLFAPDLRSSGEIRLNINSSGAVAGANLGGDIRIVDANFASSVSPVNLQHANGVLTLTTNRINVDQFQGTINGGTVTAEGGIAYRPNVQFDLGVAAKGLRVLYPDGVRESFDANLRLVGTTDKSMLGGTVGLANISLTPAFDLTSVINQVSGGAAAPPSQGFAQNLALNIAVHSTSNLNLMSKTLSVGGSANLQVRGTAAQPVILGRADISGGDIILHGDRFVLDGGTIQFVNPSETEPVINLSASTEIQQYKIKMTFQGPTDQLRTEYSSDPSLPTADIVNLLAFGQTTEASAANPTPTNQMAESVVASQVSSQVTSRLSKAAGISQLSISPVLAQNSAQGPAGAVITIRQRVTGNLFITFSSNVASTQSQTIQGQYKLSPRVSVSATHDPNGGFGFDTLINKSW
ncbi:MAG TPA: translocation/assembly module TamB domain-containing protein [Terracidiphilus sp.]|nr:translocation/assembly module TamB domain-containing protein [Terracidiphilus sp.]